jgi:hypothetical protein
MECTATMGLNWRLRGCPKHLVAVNQIGQERKDVVKLRESGPCVRV